MFRLNKSNVFNKFTISWASVIVVVLLAAIWFRSSALSARDAEESETVDSIQLQDVAVMQLGRTDSSIIPQRYTATVVARRTSQLAFQATERVDEILVDEGDTVFAGQLLARQDQSALKAQYDAAVARRNQTAAVLAELEKGPRDETIEAARAELERLVAQSKLSEVTLKRQTQLRQSRAISAQEYDASKYDLQATTASVNAAQQRLDELIAGTRVEQIDAQKAALAVIDATVAQAKTRLDQTEIKAPFAGQISRRFVDEGSLPQRGSPVLELVETDQLEVRFGVAPSIAAQLKIGQSLTFDANGQSLSGTIKQVQPKLDRSTRTRLVIVSLEENSANLVDGQTVRIQFALRSETPGFWIPSESLQPQVRGLWSVLVANPEPGETSAIAKRRDVEVLATWGEWSRVRGTIAATDQIIVKGSNRVSDGQRVAPSSSDFTFPWEADSVIRLDSEPSNDSPGSAKPVNVQESIQ